MWYDLVLWYIYIIYYTVCIYVYVQCIWIYIYIYMCIYMCVADKASCIWWWCTLCSLLKCYCVHAGLQLILLTQPEVLLASCTRGNTKNVCTSHSVNIRAALLLFKTKQQVLLFIVITCAGWSQFTHKSLWNSWNFLHGCSKQCQNNIYVSVLFYYIAFWAL